MSASAALTTIAVASDTLLVDNDTNDPVDSAPYYQAALTANGAQFATWDLSEDPDLPQSYLTAHKTVVWFTGNSYPAPITPYESELKALLDGGGRLFMSGQDILDQAAGHDGVRARLPAHRLGRHGDPDHVAPVVQTGQ